MFGYLKPYNQEIKGKHTSEYKNQYCALCHGLRIHFGFFSSLLLNYECTFLYVFLNGVSPEGPSHECNFRCSANPLKKITAEISDDALEYASFVNYHLAVLKAYDGCCDTKGLKKVGYRLFHWLLTWNKRYKRLFLKYQTMAEQTDHLCRDLYALEKSKNVDFDECSAKMGRVLQEIISGFVKNHQLENPSPLLNFANHLGMWIYLIDAYDDFEKDQKKKSFNPLSLFSDMETGDDADQMCLRAGEVMLGMMTTNLRDLLSSIQIYRHHEVLENIVWFGTQNSVNLCKTKKVKKNDCSCKK